MISAVISAMRWFRMIFRLGCGVVFFGLAVSTLHADTEDDLIAENPEAHGVVYDYFESLRSGDLSTLSALLERAEYARNRQRFESAGYGAFLFDRYRNARFEITRFSVQPHWLLVEIKIQLDGGEELREQIQIKLRRSEEDTSPLKIFSRQELFD